ncbi:MAG: rod shape-determining protein MreC [Phycisphaerae bacterium]
MMKMTPRKWFWILNFVALGAVAVGARHPRVVNRPRGAASEAVKTLVAPFSSIFTGLQTGVNEFLHPHENSSGRVNAQRTRYQNEIAMLVTRISYLEKLLRETRVIHQNFPALSVQRLRAASIDGFSSGNGDECVLDQGWRDDHRIRPGDAVLANRAVVGRVVQVGPETCTVRLMTDPRMREIAAISRPVRAGLISIAPQALIEGAGPERMRCELDQSIHAMAPKPGDLVLLNDGEWPQAVAGAVIGVIKSVHQSARTSLRWSLKIVPRTDIQQIRQVVIVLSSRR